MTHRLNRHVKTSVVKSSLPLKTIEKRKYAIAVRVRSLRCAAGAEGVEAAADVVKHPALLRPELPLVMRAALLPRLKKWLPVSRQLSLSKKPLPYPRLDLSSLRQAMSDRTLARSSRALRSLVLLILARNVDRIRGDPTRADRINEDPISVVPKWDRRDGRSAVELRRSATSCTKVRRFWFRLRKNRSQRRARELLHTSRCPAG